MQTKQTKAHNLNRVAEVWMDEYSSIFYNTSVHSAKNYNTGVLDPDPGNIDSRVALREKHKCKSFDWYVVTTLSCHLSRPLSPLPFNKPHPFFGFDDSRMRMGVLPSLLGAPHLEVAVCVIPFYIDVRYIEI